MNSPILRALRDDVTGNLTSNDVATSVGLIAKPEIFPI
jgi:hypothetical protein